MSTEKDRFFVIGLGYALELLHHDMPSVYTEDVMHRDTEALKRGLKIEGQMRVVQDRFAVAASDFGYRGNDYFRLRDRVFKSWKDWR